MRIPSIVSFFTTIGFAIGTQYAPLSEGAMNVLPWAIPLTVFLALFIPSAIREPYRKYREKAEELDKLTAKRLEIEVEKQPEHVGGTFWGHLIVHNPSSVPIKDCYGELLSFTPNRSNRPYQGVHLPWSSYSSVDTQTCTIGCYGRALLDIAMTDSNYLYITTLSPDAGRRGVPFPEPPGTYIAEIQVGSTAESFLPTKVRLKIVLRGGNLRMKGYKRKESAVG